MKFISNELTHTTMLKDIQYGETFKNNNGEYYIKLHPMNTGHGCLISRNNDMFMCLNLKTHGTCLLIGNLITNVVHLAFQEIIDE